MLHLSSVCFLQGLSEAAGKLVTVAVETEKILSQFNKSEPAISDFCSMNRGRGVGGGGWGHSVFSWEVGMWCPSLQISTSFRKQFALKMTPRS